MTLSMTGALLFWPFVEPTEERLLAHQSFSESMVLNSTVRASMAACLCILMISLAYFPGFINFALIAYGALAIVAGMFWSSGLKTRAVNMLSQTVVYLGLLMLFA